MGCLGTSLQKPKTWRFEAWFSRLEEQSLITQMACRFGREKDALWRKTIFSKYGWETKSLVLHLLVDDFSTCSTIMQDILNNLLEDAGGFDQIF